MLKRFHMAFAALLLAVPLATPAPAVAGMDDIVSIEVLDGGITKQGTYLAAIKLTLSDGWKTYWRAPGDAGIPPQITWRGSRNVEATALSWPTPAVFNQNGMRSIGYADQMILPIEITPQADGKPVRLKGEMDIGVCKDVCVPSTLKFNHELDLSAARNPSIAAALAQRPFSEREAGVKASVCHLTPTREGIRVEAHITMPSAGGKEVAVIEAGNPEIWASEPETRRKGNTLVASSELVHASGKTYALDRSRIRITVLGKSHAVDIRGCTAG